MNLDPLKVRRDFPILHQLVNGKPLIYFDNAATTQKPQVMIDALSHFYTTLNSNIHRGVHTLSQRATAAYEDTREYIAQLYNCKTSEVVFTKSDTESLNLLAHSLNTLLLEDGDTIVLSESEHHSNIVPWQLIGTSKDSKYNKNIIIEYLEFDKDGLITLDTIKKKVTSQTKILSLTWASNTFGIANNVEEIITLARSLNPHIIIILDAAQYVAHHLFDFKQLGADFITFSAHKVCGPTGVGVLIGKEALLNAMPPFLGGGDMIREVDKLYTTFNDLPYKFEAGTPNIADVVAFKASLEYLNTLGFETIHAYERKLASYLLERLSQFEYIDIYGAQSVEPHQDKFALVSFNIKGVHAHDVGTLLDEDGIAVRSGHHCTQLIMKKLNIPASVRASLYFYNTFDEIDTMIDSIQKIEKIFR